MGELLRLRVPPVDPVFVGSIGVVEDRGKLRLVVYANSEAFLDSFGQGVWFEVVDGDFSGRRGRPRKNFDTSVVDERLDALSADHPASIGKGVN